MNINIIIVQIRVVFKQTHLYTGKPQHATKQQYNKTTIDNNNIIIVIVFYVCREK